MTDFEDSPSFMRVAVLLCEEANRHGWILDQRGSRELLANRVHAVAAQLGVSPRHALDTYFDADSLRELVRSSMAAVEESGLGRLDERRVAIPLSLAGRIAADMGHPCRLSVSPACNVRDLENIVADVLVDVGFAIAASDGTTVMVAAGTLRMARTVLISTRNAMTQGWFPSLTGTPEQLALTGEAVSAAMAETVELIEAFVTPLPGPRAVG